MAGIPWATSTRQVSGMELQPLSTSEREMFNQLFWSLSPVGGRVTGQQVKGLFMKSALPQHVLAHIWSLVDTDADGHIDCMQFSLAMHLVRNAMCGCPLPSALPPHILQAFVAPMPPSTTETHNGVSHMLHSAKRHSLAFEESRRANMEAGEAELTRRRALQRQRQQEEKEREERDREQQRQRQREKEEECRRKDLEAERDRMRRDVGKLKVRHTELNGELNHWQARKEALEQRMEEMRKDASVFRNELDSTTQMIVQLQAETDSLMEQLQRAQKDVQELQVERQSLEEQTRQGKQSQSDGNQEAWGGKAVVEKQRLSLVQRFADLRVIEKQIYQSKGMEESSSMQKADHLEEWNNEIQGATGRVEKRPNVAYLLDKTKDLLTKKGTLETSNQANDSTILPRDPFLPVTSEEGSTTAWVDRNGMSSGKLGFDSHFDPFGTSETTSVNDDDSWADFSNFNTMSESSYAADKSSQRSASVPVSKANLISTKDDGLHVQATALCPFQSDQACHLSFQKGATIMVIEQKDLWWLGESGGRRGWFPKSYVRLAFPGASGTESRKLSRRGSTPNAMADKPTQQKNSKSMMKERSRVKLGSSTRRGGKGKAPAPPAKEEKCVALYTYSSNEGGDLSFREGDVITVSKKEGDWWTGSHGGRAGIFPANHVRMLQTMETNNPSWAFVKKTGLGRVVGLYNYTAHNCDEISFSVGQVITVTKKQHSDWWEGELGGVTGLFPSNYVKAL